MENQELYQDALSFENLTKENPDHAEYFLYKEKSRHKKTVFSFCMVFFCVIDLLSRNTSGSLRQFFQECTFLVLAIVIMNGSFKMPSKPKYYFVPYLAWGILYVVFSALLLHRMWGAAAFHPITLVSGAGTTDFAGLPEFFIGTLRLINVGLGGFLCIRTILRHLSRRKKPVFHLPLCILWMVSLLMLLLSKNANTWPIYFLFFLPCYYFTEYTRDEKTALFEGILEGIPAAFYIFLAFSLMFRVFDTAGYAGLYIHYEENALFSLTAFLCALLKWYYVRSSRSGLLAETAAGLSTAFIFSYILLTTVPFVIFLCILSFCAVAVITLLEKTNRTRAMISLGLCALLSLLLLPVMFQMVRHIPSYFGTPLIYQDENRTLKIWIGDSENDPRYTEFDEFTAELSGQLFRYTDPDRQEHKQNLKILRRGILKAYASHLNLLGHTDAEKGFWITDWYYAPEPDQFITQILYDHGIFGSIFFLCFALWLEIHSLLRCKDKKQKDNRAIPLAILFTTLLLCGCTFPCHYNGDLPFTLFFLLSYYPLRQEFRFPLRRQTVRK